MKQDKATKDFTGYCIYSRSSCCRHLNGKIVAKTVKKAFPADDESSLYIVKVKGIRAYQALYEDEMVK